MITNGHAVIWHTDRALLTDPAPDVDVLTDHASSSSIITIGITVAITFPITIRIIVVTVLITLAITCVHRGLRASMDIQSARR